MKHAKPMALSPTTSVMPTRRIRSARRIMRRPVNGTACRRLSARAGLSQRVERLPDGRVGAGDRVFEREAENETVVVPRAAAEIEADIGGGDLPALLGYAWSVRVDEFADGNPALLRFARPHVVGEIAVQRCLHQVPLLVEAAVKRRRHGQKLFDRARMRRKSQRARQLRGQRGEELVARTRDEFL